MATHINSADLRILVTAACTAAVVSGLFEMRPTDGVANAQTTGLVAAYGFDEATGSVVTDASGNGNSGALMTGTTWTAAGRFGAALQFNGITSGVTIADASSLDLTTGMTLEAWVFPTVALSDWRGVIGKDVDRYYVMASSNANVPAVGGTWVSGNGNVYAPNPLSVNTWTHLAATYDGVTVRLYSNGVQVVSSNLPGSLTTSNAVLTIGHNFYGERFIGLIDEVRIYNRALTGGEIQIDMGTPIATGPRLTITQPSDGATLAGPTVSVGYSTSGDPAGVDHVHFQLDDNPEVMDLTLDGSYQFANVAAGSHVLRGYLARSDHSKITGSDAVPVNFTATLPDTEPPSAPSGLSATASGAQISVNWMAATDNVGLNGYRVERCQYPGCPAFAEIAQTPSLSYTDSGLTSSTTYSYRVRAVDAAGLLGPYSTEVTATTASAPTIPPGLIAAYGFDEGMGTISADASGHGNQAALTNGAVWTSGKFGGAVSFSGTSAVVGSGNLDNVNAFSYCAWIFPESRGGQNDARIVHKGSNGVRKQFQTDDSVVNSLGLYVDRSSASANGISVANTLTLNQWQYVCGTYSEADGPRLFKNGVEVAYQVRTVGAGATGDDSSQNFHVGNRSTGDRGWDGLIDEVRIYQRIITPGEMTQDLNAPLGGTPPQDATPPEVAITFPASNALVSDIVTLAASASDNSGVAGVQFLVDGVNTGAEDIDPPYGLPWDTRAVANGGHILTARARDVWGNLAFSLPVSVDIVNANSFQNEILATGFDLPTSIEFLPDGRMLVTELQGRIKVLPAPYTQPDSTLFLQLANVGSDGVQQGIYDMALDPDFETNHFYYVFYTAGTPNHDRLSRFTADASLTGTIAGSELVLYEDPGDAHAEHHGGAVNFGNDGKIYFTTGEQFNADDSPRLASPRGKIHRINKDGTVPTDNPFHDGAGPNWDSIWARGLRNPFRAYYDAPTDRLLVADVGGNEYSTAREEVNIGAAGANYGWPNSEGPCSGSCTSPLYSYPHNGRDGSITGGFVYHGSQFPSEYQGSYFFADYTQNWIRRLTFDASGNVNGEFNFEPADGSLDGPYGDIVYLTEGPDGALYYVDLGYSDIGGTFGVSRIRRIRYVQINQPPVAAASADITEGPSPLTVTFSSAGSLDPEDEQITYLWTFGDGTESTDANPVHTYLQAGQYTVRLTVSDGVHSTLAAPLFVDAGQEPVAVILSPQDGSLFRAGDVITFNGTGIDAEDGSLAATAFTWRVDFLHSGHVHPGVVQPGITSGTFTIPTAGHDFSGDTRYRITLTVVDSDGLQSSQSVIVHPDKVNLSFSTIPAGLTLHVDGIARTSPFVHDTLIGFGHTIEAQNQMSFTFTAWSDGGAQNHAIIVPAQAASFVASFAAPQFPSDLVAAYAFNEGSGTVVTDSSSHGNQGTLVNGPSWTLGKHGSALSFNGGASRVDFGSPSILDNVHAFSYCAWIYPRSAGGQRDARIVHKGSNSARKQIQIDDSVTNSLGLYVDRTGTSANSISVANTLSLNQWQYVCGTYSEAEGPRLFKDGVEVAYQLRRVGSGVTADESSQNFHIGNRSTGDRGWDGLIDDVRIYDTIISQNQMLSDMGVEVP